MGFLDDVGRGAVGFSTGGFSELGRKNPFGLGSSPDSTNPAPWNPLTAKNINISPDLKATLGGIGTSAYNNIGANYGGAATKMAGDTAARGLAPGSNSYGAERLGATKALDTGNLESALGGQMGQTAYSNALANRDYGQQMTLADQIAALNRPSTLSQIFSGIGAVGKPVAQYAGMGGFKNWGSPPTDPMAGVYGQV
jgi:hypothetical protein